MRYNQPAPKTRYKARKTPKPIAGAVEKLVKSLGISRSYHGWLVVTKWPQIVGEQVAKAAKAFRFDDGVLFIAVPDAAWRQNLAMETDTILQKIRSYSFGRVVTQLRFVHAEKGYERS
jgi:predicted nucleic acid-binding Zn ribbon protein